MDFDTSSCKCREDAFKALDSSEGGLRRAEAETRQRLYGKNQVVFHRATSPLRMLAAEIVAPFPLLLLGASILSFIGNAMSGGTAGYGLIGAALLGVVLLNAFVSFLQNYKSEKLMISFLDFIPKTVALLRDGRKVLLDAREVVPGDIL
ncbi:MAG TPA: cation-transporting P-type ATPase, partial [Candidatus Deferrimicrobiaceae bacterium]